VVRRDIKVFKMDLNSSRHLRDFIVVYIGVGFFV